LVDSGVFKEKKYNAAVVKYDKNWNIVAEWPSISEAERQEGKTGIGKTCRTKPRFYKGFTYRFKDDKEVK
jgi:mannose-1-phosphate guanylyltransferase